MKKRTLIFIACLILIAVYVGQQVSYAAVLNAILPETLQIIHPYAIFIINKTIRLTLNDIACMLLIYALFPGRAYLKVAFWLFLIEVFLILPVYFIIKLNFEGTSEISSPLLSQIHRLIVNPLLMFLLMVGFLYQKITHRKTNPNP